MDDNVRDVVIVGGGAGGAELAVRLACSGCAGLRLIDQSATHVWKPRLHELAAGAPRGQLGEIAYADLAERWGFVFEQAELSDVDPDARTITLTSANGEAPRKRDYRLLVLALGGVTPDLGVPGVAEHAAVLDRAPDADALYQRFSAVLAARASAADAPPARVVIVGTGLTGVELAGHLASDTRAVAKAGHGRPQTLDIRLIEADERFMPGLDDDRLRQGVRKRLDACGVTIHTGQAIAEVDATGLTTEDGTRFAADLTIWAAGRIGAPLATRIAALVTNDRQQWLVRDTLQVRNHDDVFALGDCSVREAATPWPATAQVASQQAEHLAEQIMNRLDGETALRAFSYQDKGVLMSFGDGGDLGRIKSPLAGDVEVQGKVSHTAYRGLERQHQWVLLGTQRTLEGAAGDVYETLIGPRLKGH